MSNPLDELTVTWTDEQGRETTREIDKKLLSKGGAWVTVVFLYQDMNMRSGEYGPQKVRIQRYQKRNGKYIPHSKFNISSGKQALDVVEILNDWFDEK